PKDDKSKDDKSGAKPDPAAEEARKRELAKAFDAVVADLNNALGAYQRELGEAKARNLPPPEYPKHPNAAFYARFDDLGKQGEARALWWCLTHVSALGLQIDDLNARKYDTYERMVRFAHEEKYIVDVATFLTNDAMPGGVGQEGCVYLLGELEKQTTLP